MIRNIKKKKTKQNKTKQSKTILGYLIEKNKQTNKQTNKRSQKQTKHKQNKTCIKQVLHLLDSM